MAATRESLVARLRDHQFAVLLLTVLAATVVYPLTEGEYFGHAVFEALAALVVLTAIFALSRRRLGFALALLVGIPALVAVLAAMVAQELGVGGLVFSGAQMITGFVFATYAAGWILGEVLRSRTITADRIFGGLCVYLLIGVAWAMLYAFCTLVDPGSLVCRGEPVSFAADRSYSLFIYYSFVTLSTLGYGDVIPATSSVRTLAWVEAVLGQIFLAVFIAKLIAVHVAAQPGKE